ncbi:MAG: hemerythrin domain-containing protein [Leptonema sp. (in: bacteria)]
MLYKKVLFYLILIFQLSAEDIVINGFLDLSITKSSVVSLKGNWEFYWNEFVSYEELLKKGNKSFCYVPRNWILCNPSRSGQGYATYFIKIQIPKEWVHRQVAIYIPTIGTSYKLFVNGREITEIGTIAKQKEFQKPMYGNQFVYWTAEGIDQNIYIYVANFHHRSGGLWYTIEFGLKENLERNFFLYVFYDLFVFGSVFMMFLFHLGVFFQQGILQNRINLKSEINLFYFAIFCFLISIRALLTNHYILYMLLPKSWMDWSIFVKVEYLTHILGTIVFTFIILNLYEYFLNSYVKKFTIIVNGLFFLETILLPPLMFTQHLIYNQIVILLIGIYILFLLVYHIFKRTTGAIEVLLGSLILFIALINDILYARAIISTAYIFPFGLVGFILLQSFMFSKIFQISFFRTQELIQNLKQENEFLLKFIPKDILQIFEINKNNLENKIFVKRLIVLKICFINKKHTSQKLSSAFVSEIFSLINHFDGILYKFDNEAFTFIFPIRFPIVFEFINTLRSLTHHSYLDVIRDYDYWILMDLQEVEIKTYFLNQKFNYQIFIPQLDILTILENFAFDLGINCVVLERFILELKKNFALEEFRFLLNLNYKKHTFSIWEIYFWNAEDEIKKKSFYKQDLIKAIDLIKEEKYRIAIEILIEILRNCPKDRIILFYLNYAFLRVEWFMNIELKRTVFRKVDIQVLDKQHFFLNKLLEYVTEIDDSDLKKDTILKLLNYLEVYANLHFTTEEILMEELNYLFYEQHKKEHKVFIQSLKHYINQIKAYNGSKEDQIVYRNICNELKDYLYKWLLEHIHYSDVEGYGNAIQDKEKWKNWLDYEIV